MEFLYLLESIRTPLFDKIFQWVTLLGQESLVLGILCLTYWCINKSIGYQLAFSYFTSGLLVQSLKVTFRIDRPWILDSSFTPVDSAVPAATGYSFPSGHTQGGTSLFTVLAINTKHKSGKILCIASFILIGFSRMYLGVHTPKDVLVSMGISLLFAFGCCRFIRSIEHQHAYDLLIASILALISTLVLLYAVLLLKNGAIDGRYAGDCCKAAGAGLGFSVGWLVERRFINFSVQAQTKWRQLVKFTLGISVLVILKSILKSVLGTSLPANTVRYFLLVQWLTVIYPLIIKRYFTAPDTM